MSKGIFGVGSVFGTAINALAGCKFSLMDCFTFSRLPETSHTTINEIIAAAANQGHLIFAAVVG